MTSREKFEAWMTAEQWFHGSDFEWDERRNCYAQFGIHLAYKAFLAAEGAAEQKLTDMAVQLANAESKCRELAAELHSVKSAHQDAVDTIMNTTNKNGVIYTEKPIQLSVNTPSYDAFLAEVRAQGLERLAKAWYAIANETASGISISESSRLKYRQRADDVADFANEIRKEAAK